jgi:hypothetical protein
MVRLQIFKTLKNKKNRKEMLMFCEFIKQELTVTNIDTLLYYTEEKEHASTSCFGMWGAQRHITAATRCGGTKVPSSASRGGFRKTFSPRFGK